jgi:hypothetical protein
VIELPMGMEKCPDGQGKQEAAAQWIADYLS